jgi:hypothetical protein
MIRPLKLVVIAFTFITVDVSNLIAATDVRKVVNPANGHTYHLIKADDGLSGVTWTDAYTYAVRLGGNLVTINDAKENDWLVSTFADSPNLWTGLTDRHNEGVYRWSSGQPVGFTNWHPGEPNNMGGDEDYVHVSPAHGYWNDLRDVPELLPFYDPAYDATPVFGLAEVVPFSGPQNHLSTGVTDSGRQIDYGSFDNGTWVQTQSPSGYVGGVARVIEPHPDWFDPGQTARWVGPKDAIDGMSDLPAGTYVYENTFDYYPESKRLYSIEGWYGSDDGLVDIRLNDTVLVSGGGGFTSPSSFSESIQESLRPGANTLTVTIDNAITAGPSPTGFVLDAAISSTPYSTPTRENRIKVSPILPTPSAKNLVVITHGLFTDHTAFETGGWVRDMENAITERLGPQSDWTVVTYDWTADSKKFTLEDLKSLLTSRAKKHGYNLGQIVSDVGYDHIHLIGHSAGGVLITAAAEWIQSVSSDTELHLTYLDAYTLNGQLDWFGRIAANAEWVEHYINDDKLLPFTQSEISNTHTVNVTAERPSGEDGHAWPRLFYQETITEKNPDDWGDYGFPLSRESGFMAPNWNPASKYAVNNAVDLPLSTLVDSRPSPSITKTELAVVDYDTVATVTEGNVSVFGTEAHMQTASPAWFAAGITLEAPVDFVSLELDFASDVGAEGLFALYWNGEPIGTIDERYAFDGFHEYVFSIEDGEEGHHTLSFRLDPFTETDSVVSFRNVTFGSVTLVPEPSCLLLTLSAIGLSAYLASTRCTRNRIFARGRGQ